MNLSVVMPVFNEAAVIGQTYGRVDGLLQAYAAKGLIDDYEVLFVDDGSGDGTLEILRLLASRSPRVKVLSFSRNFGHQPALAAGILHASGDVVVSLDADLQDPPELMEEMIGKYLEGNDIVYAVRKERMTDTFFKRTTARFFYRMMKALGVEIIYDHADYRLISRKVAESFRQMRETNLFLRGIFPFMGFRHDFVYFDRQERRAGETKYPLKKMVAFAWDGVTSFSAVPLRLASLCGMIIFLFSILLIIWALYTKFTGAAVPGWASTVIPIFLVGGLNILFMGLIGEYVGKVYREVKNRPIFIIKEKYNIDV